MTTSISRRCGICLPNCTRRGVFTRAIRFSRTRRRPVRVSSNHELNQPGCYRDVKDTTCTALFRIVRDQQSERLFDGANGDVYFMAWTTTPWTLPSNTALAVGPAIRYVRVRSFNPYTGAPLTVFLAKDLCPAYFPKKNEDLPMDGYEAGGKNVPFRVEGEYVGKDLAGIRYEPLLPWIAPDGDAFRVITGDYVTTEDGTGIVHIAPTFGADDDRVAKQSGIPPLVVVDRAGKRQPMVDRTGKFFRLEDLDPEFVRTHVDAAAYGEFAGRFVKNAYDPTLSEADPTLDVDLCMKLKFEGKAFRIEKHTHNYPHCWRTDKPVLYYPLDSWFIRTTAVKDRLIALNRTIDWKPESTGSGRFGKWLENLVDWNLSRSRYWGTPLPIWATEDHGELKCIGSVAELKAEIDRSVEAGFMSENPLKDFAEGDFSKENYAKFDLHRPYVDQIVLVSSRGERMSARAGPDRRVVRLGSHALRAGALSVRNRRRGVPSGLPGRFRGRGRRSDAGLVLHAACAGHDAVRQRRFPAYHLERTGARQERQQDEQAVGQRRRSVRGD